MDQSKRERLESKGWKVGTVSEFLELTPEETMLVEIKLALSRSLKERLQRFMTQGELATRISSGQPRIANAENGDASVPLIYYSELFLRLVLRLKILLRLLLTWDKNDRLVPNPFQWVFLSSPQLIRGWGE